jgi:hypothetical protein
MTPYSTRGCYFWRAPTLSRNVMPPFALKEAEDSSESSINCAVPWPKLLLPWTPQFNFRHTFTIHPAHVLCPSCVPEKVCVNKEGSAFFWDFMRCWLVMCYWRFGILHQPHLQGPDRPRVISGTLTYKVTQGMVRVVIRSHTMQH